MTDTTPPTAEEIVAAVLPEETKKSAATRIVELAEHSYELGCTPDGEPFAVPRTGPPIVRMLRGGPRSA